MKTKVSLKYFVNDCGSYKESGSTNLVSGEINIPRIQYVNSYRTQLGDTKNTDKRDCTVVQ